MYTKPKYPGRDFFIVGASGFIGNALTSCLAGSRAMGRHALDLADHAAIGPALDGVDLSQVRYGVITAGITAIRRCEDEPEATRAVNVDGTLELARLLRGRGIKVIWLSSDYVFDGRGGGYADDAPLSPVNEYGRQKAEVEQRLPEVTEGDCLILRLGKTYDLEPGDGTLLAEMASLLLAGKEVRAATDQTMNPTCVDDVVTAVHELAPTHCGVVNCCTKRIVTRLDVARSMALALRVDPVLITPISLDDLDEPFIRPKDTGLVPKRLPEHLRFMDLEQGVAALAGRVRS